MPEIRVAWSPSSFGAEDDAPVRELRDAGVEIIPNPYGRRLTEDEIIEHVDGVDGLVAGLEPLTERVLRSAPRLRAIARVGIGTDNVDLVAAQALGIIVSNTPDAPTGAVAELTVAAALTLMRGLVRANQDLHEGRWEKHLGDGLPGTTVLVVGYGRIGRAVAGRLSALGARILACDPHLASTQFEGAEQVELTAGLARADLVTLHVSGSDPLLRSAEFAAIKRRPFLLNSARAELVDEQALCDALDAGVLRGAWFDVFWTEPYRGRLSQYPEVLLTPHLGTYTRSCRRSMELAAVRNLLRDLTRVGLVSP